MFDLEPTTELVGTGIAGIVLGWFSFVIGQRLYRRFKNRQHPPENWQRDRLSPALQDLPDAVDDQRTVAQLQEENLRLRLDAQDAIERLEAAENRNQETMRRMAANQLLVQENEQAMDRVRLEIGEIREIVTDQLGPKSERRRAPIKRPANQTANLIDLTEPNAGLPGSDSQLWTALTSSDDHQFEKQWSAIESSWSDSHRH